MRSLHFGTGRHVRSLVEFVSNPASFWRRKDRVAEGQSWSRWEVHLNSPAVRQRWLVPSRQP